MNYNEMFNEIELLEKNNKSDFDLIKVALIGIKHKYPACCILHFCEDISQNKLPAQLRGNDPADGHIPCDSCKSKSN